MSLTVPETTKHPCATCDDGLANKPGGICGQCFMDGKIAPSDDGAFDDPLEPAVSDAPNGSAGGVPELVQCRIDGCDELATHGLGGRGLYANTCDAHYQAQRDKAAQAQRDRAAAARDRKQGRRSETGRQRRGNTEPGKDVAPGSLVAAAERLEAANAAMKAARDELVAARAALLELVESEQTS